MGSTDMGIGGRQSRGLGLGRPVIQQEEMLKLGFFACCWWWLQHGAWTWGDPSSHARDQTLAPCIGSLLS